MRFSRSGRYIESVTYALSMGAVGSIPPAGTTHSKVFCEASTDPASLPRHQIEHSRVFGDYAGKFFDWNGLSRYRRLFHERVPCNHFSVDRYSRSRIYLDYFPGTNTLCAPLFRLTVPSNRDFIEDLVSL